MSKSGEKNYLDLYECEKSKKKNALIKLVQIKTMRNVNLAWSRPLFLRQQGYFSK